MNMDDLFFALTLGGGGVALLFYRKSIVATLRRQESPYPLAILRITLCSVALADLAHIFPLRNFLLSDLGLLNSAEAYEVFGGASAAPGSVSALYTATVDISSAPLSVLLAAKTLTPLYLVSSPAVVDGLFLLAACSGISFLVGYRTRLAGLVFFLTWNALFVRNYLFWEGTELAIRSLLLPVVLSPSGRALSLDCRLRKKTVTGTVSTWPRWMVAWQWIAIYTATGLAKNGFLWENGDAVYYSLQLDDLYRSPFQAWLSLTPPVVTKALTHLTVFAEVGAGFTLLPAVTRSGVVRNHPVPFLLFCAVAVAGAWVRTGGIASAFFSCGLCLFTCIAYFGRVQASNAARLTVLALLTALQIGIYATLNIGVFQLTMLAGTIALLRPKEAVAILRLVSSWGRARKLVFVGIAWVVAYIATDILPVALAATVILLGSRTDPPFQTTLSEKGESRTPRWLATAVTLHCFAVFGWLLCAGATREDTPYLQRVYKDITGEWLTRTGGAQSWRMFAPQPPTSNVELEVLANGEAFTPYFAEAYPIATRRYPSVNYDRWRKIARRLGGGEDTPDADFYRELYARFVCRQTAASTVSFVRRAYQIPSHDKLAEHGFYSPATAQADFGEVREIASFSCRSLER